MANYGIGVSNRWLIPVRVSYVHFRALAQLGVIGQSRLFLGSAVMSVSGSCV